MSDCQIPPLSSRRRRLARYISELIFARARPIEISRNLAKSRRYYAVARLVRSGPHVIDSSFAGRTDGRTNTGIDRLVLRVSSFSRRRRVVRQSTGGFSTRLNNF